MNSLLALLVSLTSVLAAVPAPALAQELPIPNWFADSLLDVREDVAEAATDGKRVMLYFTQEGCPACKRMVATTFADPAIAAKTRRLFVPLAIDIYGAREVTWIDGAKLSEKALAARLGIRATPTVLFLDEKGGVAQRITGYFPPDRFAPQLDAAAAPGRASQGR